MREILILSGAETDLLAAYCWIESTDSSTAERFDQTVHAALERLQQFPEIGVHFAGRFRRVLTPGFSYGIFYAIETDERITINAVLDLRQDPAAILRRLGLD